MSDCKLNIILDIDHTLVHTLVDTEDLDLTKWEWATIPVNNGLTILRKK